MKAPQFSETLKRMTEEEISNQPYVRRNSLESEENRQREAGGQASKQKKISEI